MRYAYRVAWWRCDLDGDVYWVTPRDKNLSLSSLMWLHNQVHHSTGPEPQGQYRSWIIYRTA